jgi:hypothetical protein
LSWGGLIRGSYHGPHTFSKVSSPVVIRRSELGLLSWPLHLLQGVFAFHRRSHPPSAEMLQSGSKSLYHHVDYGRDNCH